MKHNKLIVRLVKVPDTHLLQVPKVCSLYLTNVKFLNIIKSAIYIIPCNNSKVIEDHFIIKMAFLHLILHLLK